MQILGIDPGLRNTGFGIIDEISSNNLSYIASGIIETDASSNLPERLRTILTSIDLIIKEYKPDVVSIEKVFVNVNPQSTLMLGQARGAAISGCVLHNLPVFEYTALQIKQAVVGYGHADKEQIKKMVMHMLSLNAAPRADAADALACALAHSHYKRIGQIFNMASVKKGRIRER